VAARVLSPSFGDPAVLLGLVLALCGIVWFFKRLHQTKSAGPSVAQAVDAGQRSWQLILLCAIVLVGLVIRMTGLDAKGLSHPEIYIPGLDLPIGTEPPPRHDFLETLRWHFFKEAHPFGYFMAMWAWTKVFGATAVTIRVPEAILGTLSIPLIYHVGRRLYNWRVGLIAASMLALHGFHIFWSQTARMYAPGAFFSLLATCAMLEYVNNPQRNRWFGAVYIFAMVSCAITVEFAWAVLAIHTAWAILDQRRAKALIPVITATAIAAMPVMSQAVVMAQPNAAPHPTLGFLEQYFSFGFLLQHGAYPDPMPGPSQWLQLAAFIPSIVLLGLGLWRTTMGRIAEAPGSGSAAVSDVPMLSLILLALGSSITMLGLAMMAPKHHIPLLVVMFFPIIALAVPKVASIASDVVARILPRLGWEREQVIIPLLALVPTLGIFVISYVVPLTAPRAFLIYVPDLLLVTAAGTDLLLANGIVAVLLGAGLLVLSIMSIGFSKRTPTSPRDYRGLAEMIHARMAPGDAILVYAHNWKYTPLIYYMRHDRLIVKVPDPALPRVGTGCIWRLQFGGDPFFGAKTPALSAYHETAQVQTLRAYAWRFCLD
jgi:4-amino-4-deoxy-L-arabinose transferase-like glycosyltransferase